MIRRWLCCAVLLPCLAGATDTGQVAGTSARELMPSASSERFHIEFRDAEVKETLRFLAKVVGMNLVIPEAIEGTVNVSLGGIMMLDAINSITKSNGLEYAVERDVLRVGRAEDFSKTGEDLKTETLRLKYAVAITMVDQIKQLLTERGSVLADSRTNSVIVRGTVANIEHIRRFVENVDIRDAQVLIEARIVEATRDWSRNLGIQWGVNSTVRQTTVQGVTVVGTADSGRRLQVNLPAATPTSGVGLLVGFLSGAGNLDAAITAAEQKGDLHVISEPSIVTSNGVPAHIRSGETIYVKTAGSVSIGGASAAGQSGLEKISTGVELNVTPQISVGDFVKLKIEAKTSSPDFTRTVDGIPAIIDNQASTTILIRNGETTVIGGLVRFRGNDTRRKVPFLGDVPLLGYLFQSRQRSKTNHDLMVFIRPRIVHEDYATPLQAQLPHVENVKKAITLEDEDHLSRDRRRAEHRAKGGQWQQEEARRKYKGRFAR